MQNSTYTRWDGPGSVSGTNTKLTGSTCPIICFLEGTPVKTDQGEIPIELLTFKNTINGKDIKSVTKTVNHDGSMIKINQDALGVNCPSRDTYVSIHHGIFINNEMIRAKDLVNGNTVNKIVLGHKHVYNLVFNIHDKFTVNNMVVESQDPKSFNDSMENSGFRN